MSPEQSITLFSTGFYIFLAIAVIGFGLAVFFFFRFRIPLVYALMTGKAQKKTIEKMQKSGQLRSQEEIDAEQEERFRQSFRQDDATGGFSTEAIANLSQNDRTEPIGQKNAETQETTVLETATETTVLAPEMETTVLGAPEYPSPAAYMGETEKVRSGPDSFFEVADRTEDMKKTPGPATEEEDPLTTVLGSTQPLPFESIEHTVVIHTNEII